MAISRNDPMLFKEGRKAEWEPTEAELAIAVELNTLNTFRSQFRRLKSAFSSFRAMYEAGSADLDAFMGWQPSVRERYVEAVSELRVGTEFSKVPKDVEIITYFDRRYPECVREIYDPPPVLYVKGDLTYDYRASVSIVGTRSNTDYGRTVTEMFSYQLASWGFTVISGGARGIDSIAHRSAMDAGGKTFAVLGCGIDVVFPSENKKLFKVISEKGALVSEFPMGIYPSKYNFPARNRIIAAMSRGTLVVEAPEKSGALITTDLALQNGREVFAVPGRITDGRSKGTNRLIHDGAQVALEPTDICVRYGLTVLEGEEAGSEEVAANLKGDECEVYGVIGLEAIETDLVVRKVGLPAPRVLSALLILQTKGLVRELPGSRFVRPVSVNKPRSVIEQDI